MKRYFVYLLASRSRALYVGVTGDLERRLASHRGAQGSSFAAHYQIDRLVHVEEFPDPVSAIAREKQIKGWSRAKKVALIEASNPGWNDLGETRAGERDSSLRSE